MVARPAVFLDRDGVLIHTQVTNGKPYAIRTLEELRLLDGAREALQMLKSQGYMLIVVTNQPDIANGLVSAEVVKAMHDALCAMLPVDSVYYCPHNAADACECRKPKTGMFLQAKADFNLDFTRSWMVGDRRGDIEAGKHAGCKAIFVDCGYAEPPPQNQDATVGSLWEAARIILKSEEL